MFSCFSATPRLIKIFSGLNVLERSASSKNVFSFSLSKSCGKKNFSFINSSNLYREIRFAPKRFLLLVCNCSLYPEFAFLTCS